MDAVIPNEDKMLSQIEERVGYAPIKAEFLKPKSEEQAAAPEKLEETTTTENPDSNLDASEQRPRKKPKRGQFKAKDRQKPLREENKLCPNVAASRKCEFGDRCKFEHDVQKYMENKLPDIQGACPFWKIQGGYCRFGLACRFVSSHVELTEEEKAAAKYRDIVSETETNTLTELCRKSLRKKSFDFSRSELALKPLKKQSTEDEKPTNIADVEKKSIDWSNKLYLAPLTTLGNLPFRRICKRLGADITCGEMALASNILEGKNSEWALLRRHESEDVFGVQICGANTPMMARCAELLSKETDVDFIDLNCGCPIDLIFRQGSGSALMKRKPRLESIVKAMVTASTVPITVKIRTGVFQDKPTAHFLIKDLQAWGASAVAIHGRSREQRYTRYADWNYIARCADAVPDFPVFGNGDILSYEDAELHRAKTGVSGLMVARGALIKPWIFTEIKESRHWDISSSERLDLLRDFTNFGLEHWGSDFQGVERTRHFMLELMSFTHRYIPVGLLERLPLRMNDKPAPYFGRNDLETIMASPDCADWIKISEMLLGPAPAELRFVPKHKANSYNVDTETQG